MKITFNAPVTLAFSLICAVVYFIFTTNAPPRICVLGGYFDWSNWQWYVSLVGYTIGHGSISHLIGNLSLILLLGPILEEKYGSKKLLLMIILSAIITALVHILFFSHNLIGASGIAFMMITLVSLTNVKGKEIPITFILIFALYVGGEILRSFENDNVSQFAHIAGGILGAVFGFKVKPKNNSALIL